MTGPRGTGAGSPADGPADEPTDGKPAETDWQRRKRLAAVFGDVLPDTTSDERDPGAGHRADGGREDPGETWLKAQVPPHHG
ncbi:hypothetical protein [Nocardioides luti]|uniref:hypothetical protein n=1 Tax=Nocardioides luti TaxID=2761101 RepID=UPI001FE283A4|nr:hypothetical protein [Nocardioides luti]